MGKKIINWKNFYYIPIKIFILKNSPHLYLTWLHVNSYSKFRISEHPFIIKIQKILADFNLKIDIWDNYLFNIKKEIIDLSLHIIGQPLLFIYYKLYNIILTYFYFVFYWVYYYRYNILLFLIICINFIINYSYNFLLYSLFNDVCAISPNNEYVIYSNIHLEDHGMKEYFSRLNYMKAAYASYIIAEIFFAVLCEITTLTNMSILMPWFTLFASSWVITTQIKEPERYVIVKDPIAEVAIFVIENLLKLFNLM